MHLTIYVCLASATFAVFMAAWRTVGLKDNFNPVKVVFVSLVASALWPVTWLAVAKMASDESGL